MFKFPSVLCCLLAGCAAAPSAREALLDPMTWVPAAGALVLQVDDLDDDLSEWAVDHTPVFGSKSSADDGGDVIVVALVAEMALTSLAAPKLETPCGRELHPFLVDVGIVGANGAIESVLKDVVTRSRPEGSSTSGFPSGHAMSAFTLSALSNRHLESVEMSTVLRGAAQVTNVALASGVAWSRVEASRHYPSDVLAGAALGNFFTRFFLDGFFLEVQSLGDDHVTVGAVLSF